MRARSAILVTALLTTSCGQPEFKVSGVVVTRDDLASSALRPDEYVFDDEKTLPGVRIQLALDEQGKHLLADIRAETDERGRYTLDCKNLPAPADAAGNYYLVVTKAGYERAVLEIRIGTLSNKLRNTVVLKPSG